MAAYTRLHYFLLTILYVFKNTKTNLPKLSCYSLYQNVPRMLFPIFWVEQKVQIDDEVIAELRFVRAIHDWGGTVCACAALVFAALVTMAACWARKPQYIKRELLTFEKPKDEAELKLNPI